MKDLSRRSFLKGALASAASVAAVGVAGVPALVRAEGIYTPGTYSAQAQGMGTVTVTMTFSETAITDVVLDMPNETPSIGQAAAEELRARLMSG